MKTLLIILGIVIVALNLILWYSKKNGRKTEADEPTNHSDKLDAPFANSNEFLNSSKAKPLKQSAAAELGISVEELDRMSVEEIKHLAEQKGLI
jgi:FtsZ-interacting cell division protein ZipA